MEAATIIEWTGKGAISDLRAAVLDVLSAGLNRNVKTRRIDSTLVSNRVDPVVASRELAHLPGVSWIAAGYEFRGLEECMKLISILAKRYLVRGTTFGVSAVVEGNTYSVGDVVLAANSRILGAVVGSRIGESKPRVRFRISMHDSKGACGVEIREGVMGVPTSERRVAYCLVSGGRHSASTAWMAAVSGFSIRLVHFGVSDAALRQVAKLYSELSYRMNPANLSLEVVGGEASESRLLASWLRHAERVPVFAGVHLECREQLANYVSGAPSRMLFPVLLLREEEVLRIHDELGLKEAGGEPSSILSLGRPSQAKYKARRLGGARADTHVVLDALLSEQPR